MMIPISGRTCIPIPDAKYLLQIKIERVQADFANSSLASRWRPRPLGQSWMQTVKRLGAQAVKLDDVVNAHMNLNA